MMRRLYPLCSWLVVLSGCEARIEHEGTQGGSMPAIEMPGQPQGTARAPRLRRHSSAELFAIAEAVSGAAATLSLSPEQLVRGYDNDATALEVHDRFLSEWLALSETVAVRAAQEARCTNEACARTAVGRWAMMAWSRLPSIDETESLWALAPDANIEQRMTAVATALLASPQAMYRVEHRDRQAQLSGLETAQALSFFLTGAPPPSWLVDLAAGGTLSSGLVRAEAAQRLLSDNKAQAHVVRVLKQWLMVDGLVGLNKNPDLSEFTRPMREALEVEAENALRWWVFDAQVSVNQLFTAPHQWPSAGLPTFVDGPSRRGVLLLPAVLARHAGTWNSGPVTRGLFIRDRVLCTPLSAPPSALAAQAMAPPPMAPTTRASFAQHSTDERCVGCHRLIDPPGFAFEAYDLFGRHRLEENGQAIDAAGILEGTDVDGAFADADGFIDRLATSAQVRQCFAAHLAAYAFGRHVGIDEVPVPAPQAAVREVLIQLVTWPGFVQSGASP